MDSEDRLEITAQKDTSADENLKKELDKDEKKGYSSVIKQIEAEYKLGLGFIRPRWDEAVVRLKLYNNQRRDKTAVGDPLLFTIHQTVLASLYEDRLSSEWLPREEGDEEVAENLNGLAEFDYDEMEKAQIDYNWDWDALFFGYGILQMTDWDKKGKCPMPEVIDPLTWIRDPRAVSVNGGKAGKGALRFFGREILLTKRQMKANPSYFNIEDVKDKETGDGALIFDTNRKARGEAQGYQDQKYAEKLTGDNVQFPVLEWFTWVNNEPVIVGLANNNKTVVRYQNLGRKARWPIIQRQIYPMSHSFVGASITDLIEDKQRARAKTQNIALQSVEAGQFPMYFYDQNKIPNKNDVAEYAMNKFVPTNGDPGNAVRALERQQVKQEVQWIMEVLDSGGQRATATPEIQQGIAQQKVRSATEMAMVQNKVDTRYSLSAKIFGWSEKEFWSQWYGMYKKYFKEGIEEKKIRVMGAMGTQVRPLQREDIITNEDLDVQITSKIVSEAKRLNDLSVFTGLLASVQTDPSADMRYGLKKFAKLSGLTKSEVERLLPPTVDEIEAEQENQNLNRNRPAKILMTQDHHTHMLIHSKAVENAAKMAHIKGHQIALMLMRENPQIAQMMNPETLPEEQGGQPAGNMQQPNYNQPRTLQTA